MNLDELTGDERMIAEHAVPAYQAVRQAAKDAPHGQGMSCMERAVTDKGLETLRRMLTLAGSGCSFDEASTKVRELCRLEVSDDVIRAVCDQEGEAAARWLKTAPESARPMIEAKGEAEFYTDGVAVNTVDGWREMRVRVLGDGARWIWDEATKRFKMLQNVDWVVDIYHVSEHLNGCAQKMLGVGTPAARAWSTARLEELIEREGPKFMDHLETIQATASDDKSRDALKGLVGYLSGNKDSLWYKTRLSQGLPIGSGLVEGTCKNMIGKRLKLNNPRWRVRRAEHMAALRCLHYSGLWKPYWESKGLSKVA